MKVTRRSIAAGSIDGCRVTHRRTGAFAWLLIASATLVLIAGCGGPSSRSTLRPARISDSLIVNRRDIQLTPLTTLNSPRDDFGLTMSLDTTLVFFTSGRTGAMGLHSIFWSQIRDNAWTDPILAVEVNNGQSNGAPMLMPGGQVLYFTGCEYGFGDCDLYAVEAGPRGEVPKPTTPWMVPRNLGLTVNGTRWDSQPSVSADGSILFFSSDRAGGLGGRDIWVSFRERGGSWGQPLNAGELINTAFDEVSPFISPDGRTLYFSSNGIPGLGGFDLFAVELDPTSGYAILSRANNLGLPINSSSDEITLSISPDGRQAFMASNRSGGKGGYDLYRLSDPPVEIEPMITVHGIVRNSAGNPVPARIDVSDLSNGRAIGQFLTNPDNGEYVVLLRRGGEYGITAAAPNYLFDSRRVDVPLAMPKAEERTLDLTLQPMSGWVRLLVFFREGSSLLERESIADLNRAVTFLRANEDVRVEIGGHTDNQGDAASNLQISLERAEAVKSYLVGNRIAPDRIDVKGYGSSRSIADNSTEEGRAMNRRVEMRVLGE